MLKHDWAPINLLRPHLVQKIWGGQVLSALKHLAQLSEPLGETWEVSALKEGPSYIGEKKLSEIADPSRDIPYLVKFIDTSDNLSIQVHPGDAYAAAHENSQGKTECWLILEAKAGAGIYLGLKKGITRTAFENGLKNREDMSQYLNFYPVARGDFFYVSAGTIHAIGKDVLLAEIQQSSGVTYRVWDWNRLDEKGNPRELHVQKAMDVIRFEEQYNILDYFRHKKNALDGNNHFCLVEHETFRVDLLALKAGQAMGISRFLKERMASLICLKGRLNVEREREQRELQEYSSALIPQQGKSSTTLTAISDCLLLWIS